MQCINLNWILGLKKKKTPWDNSEIFNVDIKWYVIIVNFLRCDNANDGSFLSEYPYSQRLCKSI